MLQMDRQTIKMTPYTHQTEFCGDWGGGQCVCDGVDNIQDNVAGNQ